MLSLAKDRRPATRTGCGASHVHNVHSTCMYRLRHQLACRRVERRDLPRGDASEDDHRAAGAVGGRGTHQRSRVPASE
eukprot:scaffold56227_cov39-Phaeocystis_antarctica.AAC.6